MDVAYETVIDEECALFAIIENGLMLVKAPNVKHYRIPETVYRLAPDAFRDYTDLREVDVPYSLNDYEVEEALEHSQHRVKIRCWNWAYDSKRSEQLEKEIAEGVTDEYGFVYSRDHKRLLKAATVETYWIPEGVERIDRLAFVGCTFDTLHVPYTCKIEELPVSEWPIYGSERVQGCVQHWDRSYDQEYELLSENMVFCENCGNKVNNGERFCFEWRTPVTIASSGCGVLTIKSRGLWILVDVKNHIWENVNPVGTYSFKNGFEVSIPIT